MRLYLSLFLALGLVYDLKAAATVIGAEALLPLPTSGAWSAVVAFRPGDGTVVTINPPRFSWSYTPDPRNALLDITSKTFRFECSTNSSFSTHDVDVTTDINFYNYLAPFAHSPVYWRITYFVDGTQEAVSATRSFSFTNGTPTWDRSMLADTNYMATNAVHPYMVIKESNRDMVYANLVTNTLANFVNINASATNIIAKAGWPTGLPSGMNDAQWSVGIGSVALMWQLTRDTKWSNALPGIALAALASNYVAKGRVEADIVAGGSYMEPPLAFGYDWLYDLMTFQQRTQVLAVLDARCNWMVNGAGTFGELGGTTAPARSHHKAGFSHDIENFNTAMPMALAGYNDGLALGYTNCAKYLRFGLNYMLGVTYCFGVDGGMNQGRSYSGVVQWGSSTFNLVHLQFDRTFLGVDFGKNPWFQNNAEWWNWMIPVGFMQNHDPWGDGNGVTFGRATTLNQNVSLRDIAWLTRSKQVYDHFLNERAQLANPAIVKETDWRRVILLPFYSPPTNSYVTNTTFFLPEDGWAFGGTYPAHIRDGFTNGVGFIFGARPRASEYGHSGQSDLSFQLYAYGAAITDAGGYGLVSYQHSPQSQYTLLVNGYGPAQPYLYPVEDYYAVFTAWTNNSSFTYLAADGTKGYPRKAFGIVGWQLAGAYAQSHGIYEGTGSIGMPMRDLTKVKRHFLFPRKKYFVLLDELAATTNFTYSQLYHVNHGPMTIDTNAMTFHYGATNLIGQIVTTYVAQVTAPAGLSMVDLRFADGNITTNLFIPGNFGVPDSRPRFACIWTNTKVPATNGHFMTVIYPVRTGDAAPTITRIDDYTVNVVSGAEDDTITFNGNVGATLSVDLELPPITEAALYVTSSGPDSGVAITVSPNDLNGNGNGTTVFNRNYTTNIVVTLTATASMSTTFLKWQKDGVDTVTNLVTTVQMDQAHTMNAVYTPPPSDLTHYRTRKSPISSARRR